MPALDLFPTGRPPGCTSGVSNVAGVTSATKKKFHSVTGAHNRTCRKDHVPNKSQKVYQENNNLIKNLWKKLQHVLFNSVSSSKQDFALTQDIFLLLGEIPRRATAQYICHPTPCFCQQKQQQIKLSPGQGQHLQWKREGHCLVTRVLCHKKATYPNPTAKAEPGAGLKETPELEVKENIKQNTGSLLWESLITTSFPHLLSPVHENLKCL